MRVLTVRQPWAWAIIHGQKDVENRTRNIAGSYRGPVAIHAALADADNAPDSLWLDAMRDRATTVPRDPGKSDARWQPRGVVIGVVNLWAAHPDRDNGLCCPNISDRHTLGDARPFDWSMREHWHLSLSNPRPLATPVPAKGRLGLWTPDADLLAAITAGLPAPSREEDR